MKLFVLKVVFIAGVIDEHEVFWLKGCPIATAPRF